MNEPFFSIIVPVYNVKRYLRQCVDSVLEQTFTHFELVLVDDGSTDSSPSICDGYAAEDKRVKVIHKTNGGAATARNKGLDAAIGRYVMFIDSDDYLCEKEALNMLYSKLKGNVADILLFGCKVVFENGGERVSRYSYGTGDIAVVDVDLIESILLNRGHFPGAAWIMCASRDLIERYQIRFPEGVVAEDIQWVVKTMTLTRSVSTTDAIIYAYRKGREGQVTSRSSVKGSRGMTCAISDYLYGSTLNHRPAVSRWLANIYLVLLVNYSRLSAADRAIVRQDVSAVSSILRYGSRAARSTQAILKIFGIQFTSRLLGAVHSFRAKYHA